MCCAWRVSGPRHHDGISFVSIDCIACFDLSFYVLLCSIGINESLGTGCLHQWSVFLVIKLVWCIIVGLIILVFSYKSLLFVLITLILYV